MTPRAAERDPLARATGRPCTMAGVTVGQNERATWHLLSRGIEVLSADPDLADDVAQAELSRARGASLARVLTVSPGRWVASEVADLARGGFGLLVLDGLIIRRVGLRERFGAEALDCGDLLRPWQHDGETALVMFGTQWIVPEPTRLAILDRAWAARMAAWPGVGAALAGRGVERSMRLAVMSAIRRHPRLETRLLLLLWEFAQRRGRVGPRGIRIELPLSQGMIADLVGARRPSVSTALTTLRREGVIEREEDGWLLLGDAPDLLQREDGSPDGATPSAS